MTVFFWSNVILRTSGLRQEIQPLVFAFFGYCPKSLESSPVLVSQMNLQVAASLGCSSVPGCRFRTPHPVLAAPSQKGCHEAKKDGEKTPVEMVRAPYL